MSTDHIAGGGKPIPYGRQEVLAKINRWIEETACGDPIENYLSDHDFSVIEEALLQPVPDFVRAEDIHDLFLDVKLGKVKPVHATEILINNHLDGITFEEPK